MSCLLENKFKKELQLTIYEGDTMENRDDALDFIYKGFRDGRQNRRDFRRQRGIDRLRSTLAPTLEPQRSGYIQPQQEMASSPPAQEEQPTTFGDDITTPDDESTPTIDESIPVEETVGTPPSLSPEELQQQFANLGVSDHSPKGGSNAGRHDYVNEGFPSQTPDITQNVPEAAPVETQTPKRDLGTRAEGDPFPTNYSELTAEQRNRIVEDMGRRHQDFNLGAEQYREAVKEGVITQEEADEKIDAYKKQVFRDVPEEHHPQNQETAEPSVEQEAVLNDVREATQSEGPFEPPMREETEHSNAFEEAFSGMVNDGREVAQGVNQGINESFNEFNRIGREFGKEPEAQPTPDIQTDQTVAEVAPKAAPTKKKNAKEEKTPKATSTGKKRVKDLADNLNAKVARSMGNSKPTPKEGSKVPKLGSSPKSDDVLSVIEMVRDGNKDAKSELYNALGDLEDNDSPHYEDAKEAIDDFNNSSSEKKKVNDDSKSKKTQDLKTTIERRPTPDEFTRSLVKALPMKDLDLLQQALSLSKPIYGDDGFSPVLTDRLGRITNIKNVNHPHTALMQIAENPDTNFPMHPALSFPSYNVGKINPNAKPIYEGQNYSIDNRDKLTDYYKNTKQRIKNPDKGDLRTALQSDEFSILDGGKPRPLTSKDRKDVIASIPRRARQPKIPKLEYGSPFFDPSGNAHGGTWQLPILQAGRSNSGVMPHDILGMRTIGGKNYTDRPNDVNIPTFENMKEVGSIYPSEFRKLIRTVHKDKNKTKDGRVRIGESLYDLDNLKRLGGGMDDDIASEKLRFTQFPAKDNKSYGGEAAGPINIRGRGHEQVQAEPSFFDFMQAPEFEDSNPTQWTSMNDLFE